MENASSVYHKRCLVLFLVVFFLVTIGGLGYRLRGEQRRLDAAGRELGALLTKQKKKGMGVFYRRVAERRAALGLDELGIYNGAGRLLAKAALGEGFSGHGVAVSMRASLRNAKGGEIAHLIAWRDASRESRRALLAGAAAALAALLLLRPILRPRE